MFICLIKYICFQLYQKVRVLAFFWPVYLSTCTFATTLLRVLTKNIYFSGRSKRGGGRFYIIKWYFYPAPFRVRLDYILSFRQSTFSRWTAHLYRRLAADYPFTFDINFDFTIPRVITCATKYVTVIAWLKLL